MFNNLSYGGAKAEEKPGPMSQSGITGYLQGISSYIPSSIKSTIKKQIYTSPSIVDGDKDTIVGTYFDECEILGKKHKLLNICYNNGFQIWDLDHPEGVKEIFSLREGMTRFVKVLSAPADKETPNSVFYGKRPLLAVVSGEDNPKVSRNMVRIFSLRTTELVNMNKFRSPVYNVLSNEKIVLVCLKERIVGFDPVTMTKLISLPCYPSVSPSGAVALGPRWIAYTDSQPMFSSPPSYLAQLKGAATGGGALQNQSFDNAVDVATDLAKEVAQKLYYFGDIGRKKVSSYLYPDDSPPSSNSPSEFSKDPNGENGCVIIVYDFIKQRSVAVIRPTNNHPISFLTFDPSGTLLFSCSTEGTKINVYQIIPYSNSLSITSPSYMNMDPSHAFRQIYVLKRGITNASIQGISINDTSKWVAVTTSRGTTHVYAINPLGGDVTIHSHISKNPNQKKPYDYLSIIPNYLPSVLTLNAMDRIKLGNFKEENPMATPSIISGNSCFVESSTPNLEQLYVVSQTGQLLLYELRPQPTVAPDVDPNTLCLALTPVYEWDICRKTRYSEFKSQNIPYQISESNGNNENNGNEDTDSEARWLYNVEITTHSQDIRAIWGVPQFSFRNSSSSHKPSPDSLSFFDEDYPIGEVIKFEKKRSTVSSPRADFDGEVITNIMINNNHHHLNNNNNSNHINNNNSNTQNDSHPIVHRSNGQNNNNNINSTNINHSNGIQRHQQQQQNTLQNINNNHHDNGEQETELMKQLDQAIKTPLTILSPIIPSSNSTQNNNNSNSNIYNLEPLSQSPTTNYNNLYDHPPPPLPTTNNIHQHLSSSSTLPIKSTTATSIYHDNIYGQDIYSMKPNNYMDNEFGTKLNQNELLPVPPLKSSNNSTPSGLKDSNSGSSITSTSTTTNTNGKDTTSLYPTIPITISRPTPPPSLTATAKKPSLNDFESIIPEKSQPMNIVSPSTATSSTSSLSSSTSSSSTIATSPNAGTATSPKTTTTMTSPKGSSTSTKKNKK